MNKTERIIGINNRFRKKLKLELEKEHSNDMKSYLWKVLIMTEIAQRSFVLKMKIEVFEKQYFDRYTAVARHFRDWNMDWVADNYFEITHFLAEFYWPNENKEGFNADYVPFKTFELEK